MGVDETSVALLDRIRANDGAAWDRFEALYRPLIAHWCTTAGLQPADVDDVLQEVFKAVHRTIGAYHHDRAGDSFRAWLRTITRNKILDHHRAKKNQPAYGAELEGLVDEQLSSSSVASERRLVVRQAIEMVLEKFKETTRRAFWMVVVENRHPDDVAREIEIQVHSVYLAKSRVLARLRQEFEGAILFDDDRKSPTPAPPT